MARKLERNSVKQNAVSRKENRMLTMRHDVLERQGNVLRKKQDIINVEKYQPSRAIQKKFWIEELRLYKSDRETLLKPTSPSYDMPWTKETHDFDPLSLLNTLVVVT